MACGAPVFEEQMKRVLVKRGRDSEDDEEGEGEGEGVELGGGVADCESPRQARKARLPSSPSAGFASSAAGRFERGEVLAASQEELQRGLNAALGPTVDTERDDRIDFADVMLKLHNAVFLVVGKEAYIADAFVNLVARIIQPGEKARTGDSRTLRGMVAIMHNKCLETINDSSVPFPLTLLDLMRTACFALKQGGRRIEYSKTVRSMMARASSELVGANGVITRNGTISKEMKHSYATAEAMYINMKDGINCLLELAQRDDKYLLNFIDTSKHFLSSSVKSILLSQLMDGKKLGIGHAIAGRWIGDSEHTFGSGVICAKALSDAGSLISLYRACRSFSAFVAMAQIGIEDDYIHRFKQEGRSREEAINEAHRSEEWEECCKIVLKMKANLEARKEKETVRQEAGGGLKAFFSTKADWIEEALENDEKWKLIEMAFSASVFRISSDVPPKVLRAYIKYMEDAKQVDKKTGHPKTLSLLGASEFVSSLRVSVSRERGGEETQKAMTIFNAALCVLSGPLGRLVHSSIGGPFVFDIRASFRERLVLGELPNIQLDPISSKAMPEDRNGKLCGLTNIIKAHLSTGQIRGRHATIRKPEARYAACATVTSMREAMQVDLDGINMSTEPSKGSKHFSRIPMLERSAYPALLHAHCMNDEDSTSLLYEQKRGRCKSEDEMKTNAGNCCNPMRDTSGAMYFSTMFQPQAGKAYMRTLHALFDRPDGRDPKYSAAKCMNHFLVELQRETDATFNAETRLVPPETAEYLHKHEYACRIFSQQKRIVEALVKCVWNTSILWEKLQVDNSVHDERHNRSRRSQEVDGGGAISSQMPGLPGPSIAASAEAADGSGSDSESEQYGTIDYNAFRFT